MSGFRSVDFTHLAYQLLIEKKSPTEKDLQIALGVSYPEYKRLNSAQQIELLQNLGRNTEIINDRAGKSIFYFALALSLTDKKTKKEYLDLIHCINNRDVYDSRCDQLTAYCRDEINKINQANIYKLDKDDIALIRNSKNLNAMLEKSKQAVGMTLYERLRAVYKIYLHCDERINTFHKKYKARDDQMIDYLMAKNHAMAFLQTVLNVKSEAAIHDMMRQSMQQQLLLVHQDLVPGHEIKSETKINMSPGYKEGDIEEKIIYLTPSQRDEHRIIIHNGKFKERRADNTFALVDTSIRQSHAKQGLAAYVINFNGEISIFDHLEEKIAHSSMSQGNPVFAAGEIKIKNGELIALTFHSGHYKPSELNLYNTLKYFQDKGIDISKAEVRLFSESTDIPRLDKKIEGISLAGQYWYKATDIIEKWDKKSKSADKELKTPESVLPPAPARAPVFGFFASGSQSQKSPVATMTGDDLSVWDTFDSMDADVPTATAKGPQQAFSGDPFASPSEDKEKDKSKKGAEKEIASSAQQQHRIKKL